MKITFTPLEEPQEMVALRDDIDHANILDFSGYGLQLN
jgi:streptomycin 6-kinase